MLHVFWCCPGITGFWKQVSQVILKLTDIQMPDDPAAFLLHLTLMSVKRYKQFPSNTPSDCSQILYINLLETN